MMKIQCKFGVQFETKAYLCGVDENKSKQAYHPFPKSPSVRGIVRKNFLLKL